MRFSSQRQTIKRVLLPVFLGVILLATVSSFAQNAINRKGGAYIKISLQAYSFSKLLNDNAKGRGEGMSLNGLVDFAAQNNFDAVDLTGYYFPGYPKVPTDDYVYALKKQAYELGVDVCCTGVRNDFANPDPAKRAADVQHVKDWVDVA